MSEDWSYVSVSFIVSFGSVALWSILLEWWFSTRPCIHPFDRLAVAKENTVTDADEDFEHVDVHLFCRKCGTNVDIEYARCKGGVEAFLKRGHERFVRKNGVNV